MTVSRLQKFKTKDKKKEKKTISLCVYVLFINIIIIFSQDLI